MAKALANLIAMGEQYPQQETLPGRILQKVEGSPWPKPHNVLFDFERTKAGADWIDDVGWRYKEVIDECGEPLVVGHADWGAKHFRMDGNRISAIYDWDSVVRMPESRIVGEAATNFATTWYVDCGNRPTLDELVEFLVEYQLARGNAFSLEHRSTLLASIFYGAAYAARCEHAIRAEAGRTENCDFLRMLLESDLDGKLNQLDKT